MTMGDIIKIIRAENGLSQKELGMKLGDRNPLL